MREDGLEDGLVSLYSSRRWVRWVDIYTSEDKTNIANRRLNNRTKAHQGWRACTKREQEAHTQC